MTTYKPTMTRRELLQGAFGGASLGLARRLGLPFLLSQAALANAADQRNDNRILVYRLSLPGMRSATAPHHR